MGLSIYYRGTLRHPDVAETLITDVIDICHEIGWRYHPIHRSDIMPVQGLFITPEACESIDLTFLPGGRLYNCAHFLFTRHPEEETVDEDKHKWISTKTGHAGSDTHMAIIKFLRYLSEKYFSDFELKDDSHYWESNDTDNCRYHFGETKEAIEMMNTARGLMGHDPIEEDPDDEADDDDFESASNEMDEILMKRGGYNVKLNNIPISEIQHKENIERHKAMNSRVLKQLLALGMNENANLKLEFFFYTDQQDKANNLAIELTRLGYKIEKTEPSAGNKNLYLVSGWSTEINMDSSHITEWTTRMCELGLKEDCQFDGWGTFHDQEKDQV